MSDYLKEFFLSQPDKIRLEQLKETGTYQKDFISPGIYHRNILREME